MIEWLKKIMAGDKPPAGFEVAGRIDQSGIYQDLDLDMAGILLQYQDQILRQQGGTSWRAYEAYEYLLYDDQVAACLQQRFGVQQSWVVEPGDDSPLAQEAADHLKMQIDNLAWDDISQKMKYAILFGKSVAEIIYGQQDNKIIISDIRVRDRKRFRFGTDYSLRLLTRTQQLQGINLSELYPWNFWVFAAGGDHSDQPDGKGLASAIYHPVTFKHECVKQWLKALEKFAQPVPVGYYPAAWESKQARDFLVNLRKFRQNSALVIPESTRVELLQSSGLGTNDYAELIQFCDEAIAKVLLGSTMTLEAGTSRAQAEVHDDSTESLIDSDNDLLNTSFNNGPVRWLTYWNFGADCPCPRIWRQHDDTAALDRQVKRDLDIYALGYDPTPDYIRDTYGDGWLKRGQPIQLPGLPSNPPPEFAQPQAIEMYGERVKEGVLRPVGGWLDQAQKLLGEVQSLEEFNAKLSLLYPDLPLDEFADLLGEVMVTADLAGRYEVSAGG